MEMASVAPEPVPAWLADIHRQSLAVLLQEVCNAPPGGEIMTSELYINRISIVLRFLIQYVHSLSRFPNTVANIRHFCQLIQNKHKKYHYIQSHVQSVLAAYAS